MKTLNIVCVTTHYSFLFLDFMMMEIIIVQIDDQAYIEFNYQMLAIFVITFRYDQILIKDGVDLNNRKWTSKEKLKKNKVKWTDRQRNGNITKQRKHDQQL